MGMVSGQQWLFFKVADHIPDIFTRLSWEHVCINIVDLVENHESFSSIHPDWANHVIVNQMYFGHSWCLKDDVCFRRSSADLPQKSGLARKNESWAPPTSPE